MKKIILSIAFLLFVSCFLIANVAFADNGTTYYVDSVNGNDNNSGTSRDQAWRSLSKASSVTYSPGDKILLKAGCTFTDTFTTRGSGTKNNPITLSSYGNSKDKARPLIYSPYDVQLLRIHNVNGWVIENLEFSAPNGKGIRIYRDGNFGDMSDITVRKCILHDIAKDHTTPIADWKYAAISFGNDSYQGKRSKHFENITLSDLIIYDCAYGIVWGGASRNTEDYVSETVSLAQNCLIENIFVHDLRYDGIIVSSMNNSVVRNCVCLRTAMDSDPVGSEERYTDPVWIMQCNNVLVERCEIAGSTNVNDAMAIDFDGYTTNSTYQYIYSHDNVRFIGNCVYDNNMRNANCTVRYCLSVNDNQRENTFASLISNWYYANPEYMDSFKFYNNTIINASSFEMVNLRNSYIANNIFLMKDSSQTFIMNNKEGIFDFNYDKFTGTITNNYFNYSRTVPTGSKNHKTGDVGFIGADYKNINSFMLSASSQLLNSGAFISDLNITVDFYGNQLDSTHNIGCYGGNGATVDDLDNEIIEILSGFDTETDVETPKITAVTTTAKTTDKITTSTTEKSTEKVTAPITESFDTETETIIAIDSSSPNTSESTTGDSQTENYDNTPNTIDSNYYISALSTTGVSVNNTDKQDSNDAVLVWVSLSVAILGIITIIVCVVILKKMKKENKEL